MNLRRYNGMKKEIGVVLEDTSTGVGWAVRACFEFCGGAKTLLKSSRDVYIKVNAVDLKKYCYTDPEVVRETILYFKENGARNIYVIENCTQGNFTRLVFKATGITRICNETGAVPVFLDETEPIPVFLETLESFIDMSAFVFERLIKNRDENLYVSLPKLKTHSMTQITLSIKNQFGLVHQNSRIADHNYRLHQKFADIYRVIRPDVALVDGIIATNHGHYIAESNRDRCVYPMNLLIAGTDPLAVDVVASKLIGFSVKDVEHLNLCKDFGIGEGDIKKISIHNSHLLRERQQKLTYQLLEDFPADLKILRGKTRCCKEGCRRNTETVVEVLHRDHGGRGGFTILMGKGIDPKEVKKITGRVHIAGGCAIEDYGLELVKRLGKKNVTMSAGCNNLADTLHGLCGHMKVSPLKLVPLNPLNSLLTLCTAKVKGTRAKIPPVL